MPTIIVLNQGGPLPLRGRGLPDRPGDVEVFETLDGTEAGAAAGAAEEAEIRVTADEAAISSIRPGNPVIPSKNSSLTTEAFYSQRTSQKEVRRA